MICQHRFFRIINDIMSLYHIQRFVSFPMNKYSINGISHQKIKNQKNF